MSGIPNVKHLIYFEGQLGKADVSGFPESVKVQSMSEVEKIGTNNCKILYLQTETLITVNVEN